MLAGWPGNRSDLLARLPEIAACDTFVRLTREFITRGEAFVVNAPA